MYSSCIIVSGGIGKRMGAGVPKQYLELEGKPILAHTLEVFEKSEKINEIILVVDKDSQVFCQELVRGAYSKVKDILCGGKERYDSVKIGLSAIHQKSEIVFIHDGVRPFITQDKINLLYEASKGEASLWLGIPIKDTIRRIDERGYGEETLPRQLLQSVQTPQVFQRKIIENAYQKLYCLPEDIRQQITDDVMVVEIALGIKGKMLPGSDENIKITTPQDMIYGEKILIERRRSSGQE